MFEWSLETTLPKNLRATSEKVQSGLFKKYPDLHRSLNSNTIVLDYENSSDSELQEKVEIIARYNPGKVFYFLNVTPKNLPGIKIIDDSIFSGGIVITKEEGNPLFSQCIIASLTSLQPDALLSIINGNMNVGFKPVLIVLGEPTDSYLLNKLISYSNSVVFSSSNMTKVPQIMSALISGETELVDLRWIALSSWRAQLRNLSLRYDLIDFEEKLIKVTLRSGSLFGSETKLAAGWILTQLRSSVLSYGKKGFECLSEKNGRVWNLVLEEVDKSTCAGLKEIDIQFAPDESFPDGVQIQISLMDDGGEGNPPQFDTTFISGKKELHFTGAKGKGDDLESLKRYFTSGESVSLYRDSVREGDLLKQLYTLG